MSPAKKRRAVIKVREDLEVSERRTCKVLNQPRSTQRQEARIREDEPLLRERIVFFAEHYGRYGYRRVTGLLLNEGWLINHKRVERIWREEGLKVPRRQRKRRRLWLSDGSCVRLRPEYPKHVWSYDFMADKTSNGKPMRILNIIDEYTKECLATRIDRKLNTYDVIDQLSELFVERGTPDYLRSDNGTEFTAQSIRDWLKRLGVKTLFIEPGSPWENGYIESFNGKMRDELLNGEIFDTIFEAKVITEQWRKEYN